MSLVEAVYATTARFPPDERFGLVSQLRRAAVSVATNIGEGCQRRRKGFLYHLEIARGSHGEVEVELEIAKRLRYLADADYDQLAATAANVGRMLNGLINALERTD
jgi:four helix bundle protein